MPLRKALGLQRLVGVPVVTWTLSLVSRTAHERSFLSMLLALTSAVMGILLGYMEPVMFVGCDFWGLNSTRFLCCPGTAQWPLPLHGRHAHVVFSHQCFEVLPFSEP